MRVFHRAYNGPADAFMKRPYLAGIMTLFFTVTCVAVFPFLGGEFMPKLEEGNFWIRATLPTSISLEQSAKYVDRMRDIIRAVSYTHLEALRCASRGPPCERADRAGAKVGWPLLTRCLLYTSRCV